jgi:ribosomal protein S18 acetylase RimI-like enzyme
MNKNSMKRQRKQADIKILDFSPEMQPAFERLNRQWIERYFEMEAPDYEILLNPQEQIIKQGGAIFFALFNNAEIVGTVALMREDEDSYKMVKLAVDENYQGHGIGEKLCRALLRRAEQLEAKKVVLYSNTSLKSALRLYKRLGFIEVPVKNSDYARINIKMEISLEKPSAN